MRKKVTLFVLMVLVSFIVVQLAHAQLIDYNRRNRGDPAVNARTRRALPTPRRAYTPPPPTSDTARGWMANAPKARSRLEQQYDFNRDGKLQKAEVKQYLRYVIRQVERRGKYKIKSSFLKEYDSNGDGVISRLELTDLRKDVLN